MTQKEKLHALVERLPESEWDAAERALESLLEHPSPDLFANVPYDDELETDEDRAALDEARADIEGGRLTPHEQVRRRVAARTR